MTNADKLQYLLGYIGVNLHGFGLAAFIRQYEAREGRELSFDESNEMEREIYNYIDELMQKEMSTET